MSRTKTTSDLSFYKSRFAPLIYDIISQSMFFFVGGLANMHDHAVSILDIQPGMQVLELGCGPGRLTRSLLDAGAQVTAVDQSESMLIRASKRAEGATFVKSNLVEFRPNQRYDRVIWSFVLHELTEEERAITFKYGMDCLLRGGFACILDHALPTSGLFRRFYANLIQGLEPETAEAILIDGFGNELSRLSILIKERVSLGGGTAQLLRIEKQKR
ncbi:MAG: class I SAM-dependent methyltransferase [Leptospira sp.]|nr:class I SAM-dependent methyltransferase [Leptospira sp.]